MNDLDWVLLLVGALSLAFCFWLDWLDKKRGDTK